MEPAPNRVISLRYVAYVSECRQCINAAELAYDSIWTSTVDFTREMTLLYVILLVGVQCGPVVEILQVA